MPKLEDGVLLVPTQAGLFCSFALVFTLVVSGGKNIFFRKECRPHTCFEASVKFAGEKLQDTNNFGIHLYTNFMKTFSYLSPHAKTCTLKGYKPKFCAKSVQMQVIKEHQVFQTTSIKFLATNINLIDHEILNDHIVFYPCTLSDELIFKITYQ